MKREEIKKTSNVFFVIVTITALFAVSLITASQHASAAAHHKVAVHHKDRITSKDTSSSNVHKVVAVIPETHGKILNATALKKLTKGPYGNSIVIGGMTADAY
jgi:hypothetical protein